MLSKKEFDRKRKRRFNAMNRPANDRAPLDGFTARGRPVRSRMD